MTAHPPSVTAPPPPPPPLPMFEADGHNFASVPSVPRGFDLQKFLARLRRGPQGGPSRRGCPSHTPLPPPSNTSRGCGSTRGSRRRCSGARAPSTRGPPEWGPCSEVPRVQRGRPRGLEWQWQWRGNGRDSDTWMSVGRGGGGAGMHWNKGTPPPTSRAPSLRPATVPLTPSAGFHGICNRQ